MSEIKPDPLAMLETVGQMVRELDLAEKIVAAVLSNLNNRSGLGLDGIDEATKAEIIEDLEDTVAMVIQQWTDARA